MGFSYIEEDFRLATPIQVQHQADYHHRPHLPGYAFTQLLDQLDGQRLRGASTFYIRAPGGTAIWLARHWAAPAPQLLVSVESPYYDPLVAMQLSAVAHLEPTDLPPDLELCRDVDCTVLACSIGLWEWYRQVETHPVLRHRTLLAYDPQRLLIQEPGGDYFLNSAIWVTRRHGS